MPRYATSCLVISRHDRLFHVMSGHVMSRHATSCHATSCHVTSRHATSCHVMSRHVTSCHDTSCNVMSRHVTSCHAKTYHATSRSYVMSRHVTSCHATSLHAIARHVTPCHAMSCHVMSHVMSGHSTSCHVESHGTVTRPILQLTFSTRNWSKLCITGFVGCPKGCRYHTASAVYNLVLQYFGHLASGDVDFPREWSQQISGQYGVGLVSPLNFVWCAPITKLSQSEIKFYVSLLCWTRDQINELFK